MIFSCTDDNSEVVPQDFTVLETLSAQDAINEISIFIEDNGNKKQANQQKLLKDVNLSTPVRKLKESNGFVAYTFALKPKYVSKSESPEPYFDNLFVNVDANGNTKVQLVRYIPDSQWLDGTRDIEYYTGDIQVLSDAGEIEGSMTLINGLDISVEEASNGSTPKACRWIVVETAMLCVGNLFDSGGTCYFHHKYELQCGGGSPGGGGDDPGEPGDEDPIGGGAVAGDSIVGSPIIDRCLELNEFGECEDEQVDTSQLEGKAKCVYVKLEENNSDLFKDTIAKFIDDPDYDLTFIVGNCSNSNTACTNGQNIDTTGEIIITLEDVGQPALELAATILHEGLHAEIFRYVQRYESGVDPNNRERLFRLYRYYKGLTSIYDDDSEAISDAQHVYMAENYVTSIAQAIRELDSNNYPLEHYMWYGWEGLEKYDFQNKLTPVLEALYNNYQTIVNENTDVNCD